MCVVGGRQWEVNSGMLVVASPSSSKRWGSGDCLNNGHGCLRLPLGYGLLQVGGRMCSVVFKIIVFAGFELENLLFCSKRRFV